MKPGKLLLFFLFWGAFSLGLRAQDIHYSLFNRSPLTLNPAKTGAFLGTARVGGIYRDQWSSFLDDQFTTPSFYIDAPIITGFRDNDWVGVGLSFVSDEAGAAELSTTSAMLSAAYHFALDKRGRNVLTLGVQGGTVSRQLNQQALRFGDEFEFQNGRFQHNPDAGEENRNFEDESFFDLSGGLLFRSQLNELTDLELGFSFGHFTQPQYGFLTDNTGQDADQRPARATFHGSLRRELTEDWRITPSFLFQTSEGANEIALQAIAGIMLNPEKEIRLNFGPGYRVNDALQIIVGMDYQELNVTLAYDLNTSDLTDATNSVGAFEIAASYIFKIYKDPEVKPTILCPEF